MVILFTYGYPIYFPTADGAALCYKCAKKNKELINSSIIRNDRSGWQVNAYEVNLENKNLSCENCGNIIKSAD